ALLGQPGEGRPHDLTGDLVAPGQLQRCSANARDEGRTARKHSPRPVDEAASETQITGSRQRGDSHRSGLCEQSLAEPQVVAREAALAHAIADRQDVRQSTALARWVERAEHEQEEGVAEAHVEGYEDWRDPL